MSSLVRAVALAAVAALLIAGCGSDTKAANDYVDAVNKAQTDFVNSVNKLGSNTGNSPDQAKQTFTQLQAGVKKIVSDLKAVKPPDKVKALHQQLISQMSQFDASIGKAGDSLSSGSAQKIAQAQSTFLTEVTSIGNKVSATIDQINQKLHS